MFKKIKRLFEPTLHSKKAAWKEMMESAVGYINIDVLPIIAIPFVIRFIHDTQYELALAICALAFLGHVLLWVIHASIKTWDVKARYAMSEYIERVYRKKIFLKDHKTFDVIGTGKVQSIVQKGVDDWSELNWQVVYQIPKLIVGVGTGIYVMSRFDAGYLTSFLILMLCSYLGYARFKYLKKKVDEKVNDIDDKTNEASVRSIMSRQEIVFSNKVDHEIENFVSLNKKSQSYSVRSERYDFFANISLEITGPIISFVFVGYMLYTYISSGKIITDADIAALIFLIYFASRFIGLMYMTAWMISQILDRLPKIEKFWNFLDTTPDLVHYEKGLLFEQRNKSIIFDAVHFSYGEKKILENLSLTIPHGKKIALVGTSGSGKTTIAKLISGYMYPDQGSVLFDDQNIQDVSLKSFYAHIGYLTQEPLVFDGTVRENLLYALDGNTGPVSDDKLFEALRSAECEFITDLESHIGEKGVRLSGGEKQRLAIAKLILKNPEIIILDEPTSALDSFSEEKITIALDRLFINKTVIIIAHRLQTIKKADDILVIEQGKVIEQGTHQELLEKKTVYYKMVELQSGF